MTTTPALSRTERSSLADLLDEVGPDAPTLCGDWSTRDLAAHLVARDRAPLSLPGLVLGQLAGLTERIRVRQRDSHSYAELVELVRRGAPAWSPVGFPGADARANTVEFYVHHEDVRRGGTGWEPRVLPAAAEATLWQRLRGTAPLLLRRHPGTVLLRRSGSDELRCGSGEPHVTVTGAASELVLLVFGRQPQAQVSYDGDEAAVRSLRDASLGV